MNCEKGFFVTFEGGEGSGKSTHIPKLADYLRREGNVVRTLREPGGTPLGEEIRRSLKYSAAGKSMALETELLLMNASRAQLVHEVIIPALNAEEIVLCDRFYDSTTAYQGYGRGLNLADVERVINFATGGLKPDITFLINISPEQSMENKMGRLRKAQEIKQCGGAQAQQEALLPDRFEELEDKFFERVYYGYEKIAEAEPERIIKVPYIHNGLDEMQRYMQEKIKLYLRKVK